jgi:hypothetical protein
MSNSILRIASALVVLAGVATCQTTNPVNRVRDQGQTSTEDIGRLRGRQRLDERGVTTLHGILVDAGCRDRSQDNLSIAPGAPVLAPAQPKNAPQSNGSAAGIQVAPQTVDRERADIMEHLVPDMRTRTSDWTCAITGNTHGFALLLDDNRLVNLDEAGNTLALEAVESTDAGRAMLNGTGQFLKPKATVIGVPHGDRILVREIHL